MTAETAFKFYRAYKLFYQGAYDFKKYGGNIKVAPLIKQADRRFYYRISQKLNDAQVHALYTAGFFFQPRAYVSQLVTEDALRAAVVFASRAENGRPLLEADLYTLAKHLRTEDLDGWLYGEQDTHGERSTMPGSLQAVINGELPLDVACLVLLIPQPALGYEWTKYWQSRPDAGFGLGPSVWIDRLLKLDQLLRLQRPGWRMLTHDLARQFWTELHVKSLVPVSQTPATSLFA
jgi:hypothetical protein